MQCKRNRPGLVGLFSSRGNDRHNVKHIIIDGLLGDRQRDSSFAVVLVAFFRRRSQSSLSIAPAVLCVRNASITAPNAMTN